MKIARTFCCAIVLASTFSSAESGSCFILIDRNGKTVYYSDTSPIDLSWPPRQISQTLVEKYPKYPGGHLIFYVDGLGASCSPSVDLISPKDKFVAPEGITKVKNSAAKSSDAADPVEPNMNLVLAGMGARHGEFSTLKKDDGPLRAFSSK